MPGYANITLPTMTQSSSAVDTSTGTVPSWDVSDANAVAITCDSATTAPGPKVQVAYTTDTSPTWSFLTYISSGASVVITSSTIAVTVSPIAFKQMRVISTTVRTGTGLHSGAKAVVV